MSVGDLAEHPNGLLIGLPRSKTNQIGDKAELVALPQCGSSPPHRSPTAALEAWLDIAGIISGSVFRPVSKGSRALDRQGNPESSNTLIKAAVGRADLDTVLYSAHSLRAGFVTYAHHPGASDRAIAHQTRHRSLATSALWPRSSRGVDRQRCHPARPLIVRLPGF